MCILFIAKNRHPDFPLIIAANRDESHTRPSCSMHYWQDQNNILAGRDLTKGGSWLGINTQGDFCAVTNFRTGRPVSETAKSRGELVQSYLSGQYNDIQYKQKLQDDHKQYNPFNLVFGDLDNLSVFSSEDGALKAMPDGYHSLSNGYFDQQWPKMSRGVQNLTNLINQQSDIAIGELNKIMQDQSKADTNDLPSTGVSQEIEKHLSSIFITGPDYGTRTTTYLFFSEKSILVTEINYNADGQVIEQQQITQTLS